MTDLDTAITAFEHDAWRLEARDEYDIPGTAERIAEFHRTGTVKPIPSWDHLVRSATQRGARIGRVRLVTYPMTTYTEYELVAYLNNVAAGEDVRLVDRRCLDPSWDAAPDFWLIDSRVWLMRYDEHGAFLGSEPATDPEPYQELRSRIQDHAVPVTEFHLAEVPSPRLEPVAGVLLPAGLRATR